MKVGCDIVYIPRLRSFGESFAKGVLSEKEWPLYESSRDKDRFLAGRFAAKEAYLKALGIGLAGARLSEISVLPDEKGKPILHHHNDVAEVSISHDGEYAFAVALIERSV